MFYSIWGRPTKKFENHCFSMKAVTNKTCEKRNFLLCHQKLGLVSTKSVGISIFCLFC